MLVDLFREVVVHRHAVELGRIFSDGYETEFSIAVVEEPYEGVFKIEKNEERYFFYAAL